jgi:hypothetical protein
MDRYLAVATEGSVARPVDLSAKKMTAKARRKQIDEMIELSASDPTKDEIQRWVEDRRIVRRLPGRPGGPQVNKVFPMTGASVITMDKEAARAMREELANVTLIADRRTELIRPARTAGRQVRRLSSAQRWHLEEIGLPPPRARWRRRAPKVTIAVLDTGIDAAHPALAGRVSAAYRFDVDQGHVFPVNPSEDTEGHGTHVAGLICGRSVGVHPWANLISGLIIPHGYGWLSGFLFGLEWAATCPDIQIVNLSAGFPGYIPALRRAISLLLAVGVLPVVAIGNEGRDRTRSPGNVWGALSVGATNRAGRVSSFSGSGRMVVDHQQYTVPHLVAPGEGVYSCVMGGRYEAWDGTSMAAPIVSGVAARILQERPDLTVLGLREEILSTCQEIEGEPDHRQGNGLVQVAGVGALP